jgi:hypothetical protein
LPVKIHIRHPAPGFKDLRELFSYHIENVRLRRTKEAVARLFKRL